MDMKTMGQFAMSLDSLSKSVKRTMSELEPYIGDPIIDDYLTNLKEVANDLDGTVYAVEASLDWNTSAGYN